MDTRKPRTEQPRLGLTPVLHDLTRARRACRRLAVPVVCGAIALFAATSASAQGQGTGLDQRVRALEALVTALQTQVNTQEASQITALQMQLSGQARRVAALENLLMHFSREGDNVFITGANLNIVNGLGATNGNVDSPESADPGRIVTNGLGNLIVGYNEILQASVARSGSHNVVIGPGHSFASSGGLVAGYSNSISGPYAAVTGGDENMAAGLAASVSGGSHNSALGVAASVIAGYHNTAAGDYSVALGGADAFAELRLQMAMDRISKLMETLSNALQEISDIQTTIIGNIQ